MTQMNPPSVAIVGAGMSGLTCARALHDAGFRVQVFDKSRGAGGRMATRRTDHGAFDHGAQYFTARDPRFRARVDQWISQGLAAPWTPALVAIDMAGGHPVRAAVGDGTVRYVGLPAMNHIGRALAEGLDVRTDCTVTRACRTPGTPGTASRAQWILSGADGKGAAVTLDGPFDWLVAATPSPQAAMLLGDATGLQAQARSLPMVPCWAVLASFAAPVAAGFDAAFVNGSALTWIARNNAKPGRDPGAECWVLHAARDWSEAALEDPADAVCARMLAEFGRVTGCSTAPVSARAHRWRYAGPGTRTDLACLFDAGSAAGACGDWLAGSRVEGACLSGLELARRIVEATD